MSEDLGGGEKIKDSMRVTNNRSVVSSLIKKEYAQIIGQMEMTALLGGGLVVYAEVDIPENMTPQQLLVAKLYEVQSFLLTTWVFFDNSINCELGFLFYSAGGRSSVSSNFIAHQCSDSRGQTIKIDISRSQFRDIREFHRAVIGAPDHPYEKPTSQLTSGHPRLARTMYIVNSARGESDLAMRVAMYCTAFETLFATSQSELSHQLAERVACFLRVSPDDRFDLYRKVKNAYALRSKIVHGSTVKHSKLGEVVDISQFCDEILREILHRIFKDDVIRGMFDKNSEDFDEYMLKNIFSVQSNGVG
ncbi:HEPN domain-containing protein [Burkholderia ubonensis]|uniref:HEPN domain-containing protein n=1 Tax=Burkholderia ubonensis TaxID=101571 RepID=UPI0012F7AE6D|nr:HEPN domain-containing protein [Burkholderia ubonensis]